MKKIGVNLMKENLPKYCGKNRLLNVTKMYQLDAKESNYLGHKFYDLFLIRMSIHVVKIRPTSYDFLWETFTEVRLYTLHFWAFKIAHCIIT